MAMTEARMGEIALKMLIAKWTMDGGVKIGPEWSRARGQISKDTGISREELDDFSKEILVLMIMKAYGVKHVSLTMNDDHPNKS